MALDMDDTASGSGFTELTFAVTEQGATVLARTFFPVAAANAFFADDVRSFGAWSAGGAGTLDVQVTLRRVPSCPRT